MLLRKYTYGQSLNNVCNIYFRQCWAWCGRGSCYGSRLSLRYLSNSRRKKEVDSRKFRPWRSSSATKQLRGQNILPSTSSLATWIAEILQRKLSITDLFLLFPGCAQNKHQRFSQLWRWYYSCWQCYTIQRCLWRGRIFLLCPGCIFIINN